MRRRPAARSSMTKLPKRRGRLPAATDRALTQLAAQVRALLMSLLLPMQAALHQPKRRRR